ncbi:LysR family transcriptional regulator [Gordonibacter sp.]|uniref:LysR family transcriptional regulator n=1 Tax=Gordonibacter sp. TaxID=1968902 RepID=UPI002FC62EE0
MELYQLKYVSSVARCGSVAKAADEFFVSRQAISKAIRSLEQEVGFEIFDRDDKMRPTESGEELAGGGFAWVAACF